MRIEREREKERAGDFFPVVVKIVLYNNACLFIVVFGLCMSVHSNACLFIVVFVFRFDPSAKRRIVMCI